MRCLLADESIFTGIYVSATDTEGREFPRWRSEKVGSERGDESMLDEKDVFIIKDIVESAIEKNNYILRDEMRENSENLKKELREEMRENSENLKKELREEMRENSENLKKELREEMRENLESLKEELRGEMRENSEELRGEMRENSEELRGEMREKSENLKKELRGEMRENSENLKTELRGEIHSAIEENNELIFDEMECYYQMTHRELEALDKKVTEISDYYRIRKLEDSTSDKLLRLYEQQQEEIEEIKKQLAM